MPWVPDGRRAGLEVTHVSSDDGQSLADGDYEFTAEDDDYLPRGTKLRLRNDGGRWSLLP
jgi:hypothetical protein